METKMSHNAEGEYYRRIMMAAASSSGGREQAQEYSRGGNNYYWPQAPSSYEAVKAYLEKYSPTNNGLDARRRRGDDTTYESPSKRRMVQWRGNYVSEGEAKALRHVFDELKDHFGHNLPDPDVSAALQGLAHLGGPDPTWEGELDFFYNVDGERCKLPYIGLEICLDLKTKPLKNERGRPVLRDYGTSWVYAYLPQVTMMKVKQYVRAGTGWEISEEGIFEDPNQCLVAIEAMMHDGVQQPKPSFWVVESDDATTFTDSSSFTRIGDVQNIHKDPEQQQIHRGIGFFAVSMEVDGPSKTVRPIRGAKGVDDEATLIFTLASFSTWGITDAIAPVVSGTPPYY